MAGVSCDNANSDSTHLKWKHTSCTIKDDLVIPDRIQITTSHGQNVECLSKEARSEFSASLVTSTCINVSNKSNFSKKTVSESSHARHICSASKAGGTYCIARWCGNSANKTPGISLFRIPKDPDRALLWLTNAEREDLKILSTETLHTKYLCMEHFDEDMFMNSCKKKLVWNALPTHFPKPDYAYGKQSKKVPQHRQWKSNIPRTAKCTGLSKFHQPTRRRPLKPKPLFAEPSSMPRFNSQPNTCNSEELKSVAIRILSVSSLANTSQCINKEQSTLKETFKLSMSDTCAVPKYQITSQLPVQGGNVRTQPNTKKLAAKCQEPMGNTETASSIVFSNLNEIVGLPDSKVQSVTSTCEYLSLGNTDSIHHEVYRSDSSAVGESNKRNVNDKLLNDETYLNCDIESLCLDHGFRETNERIYPCRYCGEMFLVKSNLVLHQTTYHSDHPVGCELCGKVLYKSRSEFMEHVCEHHNDNAHN